MRKYKTVLILSLLTFGLVVTLTTIPVSSADPEWYDKGPEWFYDNFTPEDRLNIRKAVDYAIPREAIIDGLHHGYAVAIASPIGVNFVGVYDETVKARAYDPDESGKLLAKVFDRVYIDGLEEENATHTGHPYFHTTLIAPTTNTARTQWASLIAFSLNNIGIDTDLKWWSWNVLIPRVFDSPVGTGFDYEHGGYDMSFVGWDASADPDYETQFHRDSFPPGWNAYWTENDEVEELWDNILSEPDVNTRNGYLKDFQKWFSDNVHRCIIRQEIQLFALDRDLVGFEPYSGIRYQVNNWTIPGQTSAVIAQPGDYIDLIPMISQSYYDDLITTQLYPTLSRRRGEFNLSHPVPFLAESWTASNDYKTWTVKIRQGIKWHDGEAVTADDVVFTYQKGFDEDLGCPVRGDLVSIIGNTSNVKKGADDYTVIFELPDFYPYVEGGLFSLLDILPEHVLSKVASEDWKTSDYNTKSPAVGCYAYKFKSFSDPSTIILEANPDYDETLWGHDPTMVGGPHSVPNPSLTTVTFKVVKEATAAVAGLKSGTYDVIDSQMGIQAQAQEVNQSTWGKLVAAYEWGWQEMFFNHYNPIFGMNPHDPREMYPEDYAAAPFDLTGVFLAILTLASIQIIRSKKKK